MLGQILGDADMASTQPQSAAYASATPEWSYSITGTVQCESLKELCHGWRMLKKLANCNLS